MKTAIIGGSGKMGKWFARFLVNEGVDVVLTARNEDRLKIAAEQLGVEATTDVSKAVKGAEYIVLSVPIDSFEDVVVDLQPLLASGQTVLDITSIKEAPVEIMHKHLDKCLVLGTHPVFGPGAKSVRNQNFVFTPTNQPEAELADKIRSYLEARGALVSVMTPREHDDMISIILGLAHFIAIVSADALLNFDRLKQMASIAGPTYKVLLTLAESVITEDPELYASLQMNLPGITEIEDLFLKSSQTWADIVRNKDKDGFISRMNLLKEKMRNNDPDFGKSYEDMYKLLDNL
ncbi:MAG: prephenate dehydrogenase [Dehalococcoidales bacterium]